MQLKLVNTDRSLDLTCCGTQLLTLVSSRLDQEFRWAADRY